MINWATTSSKARQPTGTELLISFILRALPIKHGRHRILDRLKPAKAPSSSPVVEFPYHGQIVQMDISDLVGWHFYMLKNFDPEVTEIIERFSAGDDTDVFWDIGANKGACSYEIATSLPLSKIVAIEPQQSMSDLLVRNLDLLAPGRHEVFPVGIGPTAGHSKLTIPSGNRGRASLVQNGNIDDSFTELVELATGEQVVRRSRYGWPTLIKIDVEGFEASVMESLEIGFLRGQIRCCVFECHKEECAGFETIRSNMERFGYRIYAIHKTAFSTLLVPAPRIVSGATDYAIVRADLC